MNSNDFERRLKARRSKHIPEGWRDQILHTAVEAGRSRRVQSEPSVRRARWGDLLWPCPQAWAALAAVWVGLLVLHSVRLSATRAADMASGGGNRPDPLVFMAQWRELNDRFRQVAPPRDLPSQKSPEPKAQAGARVSAA